MPNLEETVTETLNVSSLDDATLDAKLVEDNSDGDEVKTREEKADVKKDETDSEKPEAPEDKASSAKDTISEELARLKKQVEDQKVMIGRQSAEVHQLRQYAASIDQQKQKKESVSPEQIQEELLQQPEEFIRKRARAVIEEERARASYEEVLADQQKEATRTFVKERYPDFENMLESVAKMALADGIPSTNVEAFKRNPWIEHPTTLLNYAARLVHQKKIDAMEKELVSLKGKPQAVLKKIEKAAKQSPSVTAKSGQAASARADFSESDVAKMPDQELDEYYKNLRENE